MSNRSTFQSSAVILGLLVMTCSAVALPAGATEPVLELAPLDPRSDQADCDPDAPAVPVCRVNQSPGLRTVETMLRRGEPIRRKGNELTFVYRSDAPRVVLGGGIPYPLARIEGTDLWTLTLRVEELDRLAFSYFFVPMRPGLPERFAWNRWSGPRAPAEPGEALELTGRLFERTLDSTILGTVRKLTIYEPPRRGRRPLEAVVFAGDGESIAALSKVVEPLVISGKLPRVLLVGMNAAPGDQRLAEYMIDIVPGNEAFLAHERFFLEEVIPAIESQFALPEESVRRALFGFSASASWAVEMALRHPDRFGRALVFSPAGRAAQFGEPAEAKQVAFFLVAGTLETTNHRKAAAWSQLMEEHGVRHTLREEVAGHDFTMWRRLFPEALSWAFHDGAGVERRRR
jgi:enterochelin esterase-like enzyme